MREKWAKRIALLTGVIVILLAGLFAFIQNPIYLPAKIPKKTEISAKKR